jgi:sec-independent protein translocase protein TatA
MFAGGLGMTELLVILFIVLIIFGAGKLPEIGAGLGKGMRNFKKAVTGDLNENENESKEKELPKETPPKQK